MSWQDRKDACIQVRSIQIWVCNILPTWMGKDGVSFISNIKTTASSTEPWIYVLNIYLSNEWQRPPLKSCSDDLQPRACEFSLCPQPLLLQFQPKLAEEHGDRDGRRAQSCIFIHTFNAPGFSSVQSLSRVRLFVTPWIAARQASLSITISRSSLKLTSIESVMPSSHLSHPLSALSPPAPNPSQNQSIFQWVNSSHEVAKILEFQL